MKVYKTAIYVRISKEDYNSLESNSIINQKNFIKSFINDNSEFLLVDTFVDDGFSGVDFNRPEFLRMMSMIKNFQIDCVIVKDLSRLGRNYLEVGKYIEIIFPKLNVRFISINDNYDSLNKDIMADNYIIPFKNLINDAYCRDISIKIKTHLDIKRKNGDYIGSFVSYGYKKSDDNKNKIVIDYNVSKNIENIFKWKLNGINEQAIADRLNSAGVLSPLEYKKSIGINLNTSFSKQSKNKWTNVAVNRILKNEIYIGNLIQGKTTTFNYKTKKIVSKSENEWIRIENNHEPIISKNLFYIVNDLLLYDTRVSPYRQELYFFSGLIFCNNCKNNMIRKTIKSNNKKYFYYICTSNSNLVKCFNRINEKNLMDAVLFIINLYLKIYCKIKVKITRGLIVYLIKNIIICDKSKIIINFRFFIT